MIQSNRWLLPDGVEDMLPETALVAEWVRRQWLDTFQQWGYGFVITPMVEYLESLLTGTGNDLDLKTFKVTDQLSGRLMGVRADITPQVARMDSHSMSDRGVNRLCYADTTLHTLPKHALTHRCPYQIGCELFGVTGLAGDIEIISLMLTCLHQVGIRNIHLDLAHVGLYRGLVAQSELSESLQKSLFDVLGRKSIPELDELIEHADDSDRPVLVSLRVLATSAGLESIRSVKDQISYLPEAVMQAFSELEQVGSLLRSRFPEVTVGVDFSELRGYNYHTGLIFSAYVQGVGDAVAQGGRYDAIGQAFGCPRPATGFSADLKALIDHYPTRQSIQPKAVWIDFEQIVKPDAWKAITKLRRSDILIQGLEPAQDIPVSCDRILVFEKKQWVVLQKDTKNKVFVINIETE